MRKFSEAQSNEITQQALRVRQSTAAVERLTLEAETAKENLKLAKKQLETEVLLLNSATADALAGKEPIPNLLDQARESKREKKAE